MVDGRRMVDGCRGRVAARQRRDPGAGRRRAGARVGREALALLVPRVLGAPHVERLAAAHHIAVLAQALDGTLDLHRTRRRRGASGSKSATPPGAAGVRRPRTSELLRRFLCFAGVRAAALRTYTSALALRSQLKYAS